MNEAYFSSRMSGVIDGHVHMGGLHTEAHMLDIARASGIGSVCLVSIQDPAAGAGLPQSLYMKAAHPGRFFVFAGLNHAQRLTGGKVATLDPAGQVVRFVELGCDGIKMIEGKPTSRQQMNIPLTDPYYADYWTRVEALGLPLVWHVADPEAFWSPESLPGWAREMHWGYGPGDTQKEDLYTEAEAVLTRHPGLKVILAHFYFLSADLPRAARILDEHPGVHFDLTPGIELLYNLSRDPESGRDFLMKYADRILYGTDIFSSLTVAEGCIRSGILMRWLESDDTFRVPAGADVLLGPPEDGIIRGLSLPDDVLRKIYQGNFTRLAGSSPKPLNVAAAVTECEQLAAISAAMSGGSADETEAARVAERLVRIG